MPLISVIMACHNAEPYINKAIQSILRQSFQHFELIFVDDFSTDKSFEIAMSLSKDDSRIKVFRTEYQSGPGAARNLAISYASGEWLAVLDADDIWLPDKLERQVKIIKDSSKKLVLAGSGCYLIDASDRRIKKIVYPASSDALRQNLLATKQFPPHSSLMYRASAIHKIGGFNQRFLRSQDYDLWLRLSEVGDFSVCLSPLIEYRIHQTSVSFNRSREGYSALEYATAARVCQMLRSSELSDPSTHSDYDVWKNFMEHITNKVNQSKAQKYIDLKRELKQAISPLNLRSLSEFALKVNFGVELPFIFLSFLLGRTISSNVIEECFDSWIASKHQTES